MIKIRKDSVIEIWSGEYINGIIKRHPEDLNAEIVQVELGYGADNYMVEIVRCNKARSAISEEATNQERPIRVDHDTTIAIKIENEMDDTQEAIGKTFDMQYAESNNVKKGGL